MIVKRRKNQLIYILISILIENTTESSLITAEVPLLPKLVITLQVTKRYVDFPD